MKAQASAPATGVPTLSPADLLTPEELAARLKVKRGWITEKMRTADGNRLPVIRMGRYLRFSWPDIVAWLESQKENTPRKAA